MSTTSVAERVAQTRDAASQNPVAVFNRTMESFKGQIQRAIPKHMGTERFTRLVLTAFSTSQKLQECEPRSILAAAMTAAQMGLEIGVGGQGFLVPYKKRCSFVPGWRGLVDIVNRSGRATVWTGAVFDGDFFDFSLGDSPFVKHMPAGEDDPNKLTHVYAIGRINGTQFPVIEVWPIRKVQRHFQKMNKQGDQHYAHDNWEMYARKLPLLQVCKYMPQSAELNRAMDLANAAESGEPMTIDMEAFTAPASTEGEPRTEGAGTPEGGPKEAPYVELVERINAAKNRDGVDLILDAARHLQADEMQALLALADEKFPRN